MSVQSVSEVTVSPPLPPSTPTIRIYTPPSSPNAAPDEWDSIDEYDISVDSLPAEESSSSSTAQSPFTPSPPEEILKAELPSEFTDTPRNSSSDFIQKMGHWIYNSRVVQYMKSDERARVKTVYSTGPIWMLGIAYDFTEVGGTINLPKPDRGGRTSSLFNLITFGSSEDDDEFIDPTKDDVIEEAPRHKLTKAKSFSQPLQSFEATENSILPNKGKANFDTSSVIRRLRSLSFTRKPSSPSSDRKSATEPSSPSLGPRFSSRPLSRTWLPSISFNKKSDHADSILDETNSSQAKAIPIPKPQATSYTSSIQPTRRNPVGQNFLRPFSMHSQTSQHNLEAASSTSQKFKKPRRKTFGIFVTRDKNLSSSAPPLYPHFETEADRDPKFIGVGTKPTRSSYAEGELRRSQHAEKIYSEEDFYDSESDSSGPEIPQKINFSSNRPHLTSASTHRDINGVPSNLESNKDIDINGRMLPNRTNVRTSIRTEFWNSKRVSEADSMSSARSSKILSATATSLYGPDSFGPLTMNQEKLLEFLLDFQSRIFCCYRKDFPPIEPAFHTTDTGWGCMHRTGQSLLAQAFLLVLLGRDWRVHNIPESHINNTYRKILRWFADGMDPGQYYSIHNIARMGVSLDKKIGHWFGPSTLAHSLRRLSALHKDCPLTVHVPVDNTIYRNEITSLALSEPENNGFIKVRSKWTPVVVLLPLRLGTEKLNANYSQNLKSLFKLSQFLGIAGGRPCRSLYFVAVQDNELLYLDPHFVRPAINFDEIPQSQCPIEDYHSTIVRTMDIAEMDPSMLLGFLFKDEKDLDDFCDRIEKEMDMRYPFFTIMNSSSPLPRPRSRSKSLSDDALVIEDMEYDIEDLNQISEDNEFVTTQADEDTVEVNISDENFELL